jgi:putative transcriptional regulator
MTIQSFNYSTQFLIATPAMRDPSFDRSVVLMCEHTDKGAMGFVINRACQFKLQDLLSKIDIECAHTKLQDRPVGFGGPVQSERGFVIHQSPKTYTSSLSGNPHFSITTSRDILVSMAQTPPDFKFMVVLGYAGWSAGQLEQEIQTNAWLMVDAAPSVMFDLPLNERYEAALALLGITPMQLTAFAGHA